MEKDLLIKCGLSKIMIKACMFRHFELKKLNFCAIINKTVCAIYLPFIRPPLILYGWCCFFHYIKGGLILFWMNAFDFYSPQVKLVVGYIIERNTSLCVFFSCKFFINKLIYKWKISEQGEAIKKKSKVAFAVICVAVFFTDSFLYAYASGHET